MKQRPILFSTPMVQAIQDGRKTQTRRVVKPQPELIKIPMTDSEGFYPYDKKTRISYSCELGDALELCPYGQVGDVLWVRETFYAYGYWDLRWSDKKERFEWFFIDQTLDRGLEYRYFDNPPEIVNSKKVRNSCRWYKRPSIFMPREACRIFLEIKDIRIERLQDISPSDAGSEGVQYDNVDNESLEGGELVADYVNYDWRDDPKYEDYHFPTFSNPVESFMSLWRSINGKESLDSNPWVWVVEFKVISHTK